MSTKHSIQTLLLAFMIDQANYNLDKYSQNIEIISPFFDSFAYLLKDPRLLLLSNNISQKDINKYEFEVMALRGKLSSEGLISLSDDILPIPERIYKKGLIDCYLQDYPFLNDDASVIANYDWTVEGMAQLFTLLENTSQDYFIGFGFQENDPRALEKRLVAEHFIDELRQESSLEYDGFYEKYKNTELYMLAKSPKVKTLKKVYTL